jgi:hypothetical protein
MIAAILQRNPSEEGRAIGGSGNHRPRRFK